MKTYYVELSKLTHINLIVGVLENKTVQVVSDEEFNICDTPLELV